MMQIELLGVGSGVGLPGKKYIYGNDNYRCSLAHCTYTIIIGAVHRTAPIMPD